MNALLASCASRLGLVLLLVGAWPAAAQNEFLSAAQRRQDFEAFCRFVADEYAYFDLKATDWPRACDHFAGAAEAAADRASYVDVLERALGQLYDAHAHLGTNTSHSPRLVPSQADVAAEWIEGKAIVTDLRQGSAAARSGLRAGDEILAIAGVPVAQAAAEFEPTFVRFQDSAARRWALQVALAGRHERNRVDLDVRSSSGWRSIGYPLSFAPAATTLATTTVNDVAVVRVRNSLGDLSLVRDFDAALGRLAAARALVIDLRDTPSGGVSAVGRGLIGRMIAEERPYQRHELVAESRSTGIRRIWIEHVAPRGPAFPGPVVVLVGRWTGSMGEGIAIGLNAARGAPVLGPPMAGLLGAIEGYTLPNSGIVVRVPVEKLFHVDGTPREAFVPCAIERPDADPAGVDVELMAAVAVARRLATTPPLPSPGAKGSGCPAGS